MSESAGKTFRGLHEAYASIYANKSENLTEDTIVSEVQEEQKFEINEEKLLITMIDYLVVEGYVKTEEEALKMIPHIGEEWMGDIVSHIYLSEGFYSCIDSLIKEGYDVSSFNEEYLFELYVEGVDNYLNEQIAGDMPGMGLLGAGLSGIFGAGAWGLNKLRKAFSPTAKPATTGPSTWDYGQSGTSTYKPKPAPVAVKPKPKPAPVAVKPKPTPVVKSQSVDLDNPPRSGSIPDSSYQPGVRVSVRSGSTSTPGGGGGGGDNGDNEPPKDKKPGLVGKALDALNRWATRPPKPPKPPGPGMSQAQQKLLNIGKRVFVKDPGEGLGKGLLRRYVYGGLGGGLGIDQALGGRTTSRAIELGKTLYHRANIGAADDKKAIETRGDEDRHKISTDYEEKKKREAAQRAELERIRNGSSSSAPQPSAPPRPTRVKGIDY